MRSSTSYPTHFDLEFLKTIRGFWKQGVLDDYSDNHFLIRAIHNDVSYFKDLFLRRNITTIDPNIFPWHFVVNIDFKIRNFIDRFGSSEIENFFRNQFAAGKKHYNENQFFEALSEFYILSFFRTFRSGTAK